MFNGVLDMGTRDEMEQRYDITMETENDGEVFLDAVLRHQGVQFLNSTQGSFAGLWFERVEERWKIMAARNARRPAWITRVGESVFIASTSDILSRAGLGNGEPLIPGVVLGLS